MATAEQKKRWQKAWRDKKVMQGLCSQCGREPLTSTLYCVQCLKLRRFYSRREGHVDWKNGGLGCVPYEHRTGPITFPRTFCTRLKLVSVSKDGLTAYYRAENHRSGARGVWITAKLDTKPKTKLRIKPKRGSPVGRRLFGRKTL